MLAALRPQGRCPQGGNSVVTVQVVDTCTDCDANKITMHYLAFNQKVADPGFGEVAIRYRQASGWGGAVGGWC